MVKKTVPGIVRRTKVYTRDVGFVVFWGVLFPLAFKKLQCKMGVASLK